jgi:hypothetical protein
LNPNLGVVRGCTIAGFNFPSTLLGVGFANAGNIYFRQPPLKNGKLTANEIASPIIDNPSGALSLGGNTTAQTFGKSATLCDFLGNVTVNQTATMRGQLNIGVSALAEYQMPGMYSQVLKSLGGSVASWENIGNYSQTGNFVEVLNTALKTSIVGTGVGSLNIPEVGAGCSYHLKLSGTIEDAGINEELKIIVDFGGVTVYESAFYDLEDIKTEQVWETEIDIVCRTAGVAGTFYANGQFVYSKNGGANDFRGFNTEYESVINTTISNTFDISAQWSNQSLSNIFTCKMLTITKTF